MAAGSRRFYFEFLVNHRWKTPNRKCLSIDVKFALDSKTKQLPFLGLESPGQLVVMLSFNKDVIGRIITGEMWISTTFKDYPIIYGGGRDRLISYLWHKNELFQ